MKAMRLFGAAVLALALGLGGAQATTLKQVKSHGFVRGATANEVPYGYMNADGKAEGIAPDIAKAVWARLGVKHIAWTVTPFGSLIPGLKAYRYDFVAASMNILPNRCKQVRFTAPSSSYGEGLLVPKGNPKNLHSYADIKNNPKVKVAIVSGADQLDFLHAIGVPDSRIVMIQSNADAPSTIATGRADAYAATELTVAQLARHTPQLQAAEPFSDPVINGKSVRSYGGFAFRPQDKSLYAAFNKALIAFKKTDAYARILTHYGLSQKSVKDARNASTAKLCAGK